MQWLKDGHPIRDSVISSPSSSSSSAVGPFDAASSGKSSVDLQVLGTADSGTYTCRAGNEVGVRDYNFTLTVTTREGSSASKLQAIVTEAGPENGTAVYEGDVAVMRCRVKSLAQPHIKWLKKLNSGKGKGVEADAEPLSARRLGDDGNVLNVYTMNMGNEKYQVLKTPPDVVVGESEYLNRLVIPNAGIEDSGLYICFVTNSGFGALTYKSAYLNVR